MIRNADRILVLDKAALVELEATHSR